MEKLTTSQKIARSLTLLRAFVLVSALVLAAAAVVLGGILARALRDQAVDDAKQSLTQYTSGVLSERLVRNDRLVVGGRLPVLLRHDLSAREDILSIKVWRPDGVLAWTSLAPERIGRRYPLTHHLGEVIETGEAEAELENLEGGEDGENAVESRLGYDRVLEVYAPVMSSGRPVGAYEIYSNPARLESSISERKRLIWLATGAVFAVLWALLALLVRSASNVLRRQTERLRARSKALLEAYRKLEESSLEAIESLNATVEAKDPYTAGHSARVQQIAVAIGEELDLPKERLDPLRLGALFHDLGKLGVPDAILTKPARLTSDEFELIKRHSDEGARIVGKFGPLRATVPMIRHHHERWDGRGYPDGLSKDEIPLEAAIIGLADAWDAMTTDRPYHRALTLEEAFAEVRAGRGTQFAPVVVDAFFAAHRRRPASFRGTDEPEAPHLIAQAG